MAYFEDLAADLDCVQGDINFSSFVKHNRDDPMMPFKLAIEIGQVIKWNFHTNVPAKTPYVNTVRKWVNGGVDFDPGRMHCCSDAEPYLADSIRGNQGKEYLDSLNSSVTERNPAVIFTVGGTAVGYKKSLGAESTYGLRDNKHHSLWAGMLSAHDFNDRRFVGSPNEIFIHELREKQSFTALRPTGFTFSLRARQAFTRRVPMLPHERTALTMSHEQLVRDIDALTRAVLLASEVKQLSA